MLSGRGVLFCLLFLMALLTSAGTAASADTPVMPGTPDATEIRRILAESVARHRIQTEFPSDRVRNGDYRPAPGQSPLGGSGLTLGSQYMLWGAVTVFVTILLLTLYDSLYRHRRPPSRNGQKISPNGEAEAVRERMDSAGTESDALAAAGDYAGAMHLLLLRSIEEMRRHLGVSMAASLTSREILGRIRLEPEAHASLGDIVRGVEVSWFGTHQPDAAEFSRCRQNFQTLRRLLGGGSAK